MARTVGEMVAYWAAILKLGGQTTVELRPVMNSVFINPCERDEHLGLHNP
jgi:hypothetical protein